MAAIITSPYFSPKPPVVLSPYFNPSPTVKPRPIPSSEDEAFILSEDEPYNSYWGAVTKVAKLQPRLIQEEVATDWWKVLVACMLLNKTSGKVAIPVFRELMRRWPDPASMAQAPAKILIKTLRPLGLQIKRAQMLVQLSRTYLLDPPHRDKPRESRVPRDHRRRQYPPTPVSHLPGCGRYALDSFRIFCCPGEWKRVKPHDKELQKFLRWQWAIVACRKWDPDLGVIGHDNEKYLEKLTVFLSRD